MTTSRQPWAHWIADETILMLYTEGIRRWGGSQSEPILGCIDAALGAAYNAELYAPESEQKDSFRDFSALTTFSSIWRPNCYTDGNKRIAWACMTFVLLNFGLTLEATEDEVVEFCLRVASGEIKSGSTVTSWVYPKLTPVAED